MAQKEQESVNAMRKLELKLRQAEQEAQELRERLKSQVSSVFRRGEWGECVREGGRGTGAEKKGGRELLCPCATDPLVAFWSVGACGLSRCIRGGVGHVGVAGTSQWRLRSAGTATLSITSAGGHSGDLGGSRSG